jgi:hypothetical protein
MRWTFSVAAVAIVLVLASCSSVGTKPTPARPLTSDAPLPTPTPQPPTPTASPPPSTAPTSTTDAVAFADAQRGWGVGSTCALSCTLRVAATDTGGRTWGRSVVVATLPLSEAGDPFRVVGIRFQGDNGWIFGPNIYESHNGGRTWRKTLIGPILALEPYANEVWVVTGCATQDLTGCLPKLVDQRLGSDGWSPASPQPRLALSLDPGSAPSVLMERAPYGVAFLAQNTVTPPSQSQPPGSAVSPEGDLLFTSRNLGRSWQNLPAPCAGIQGIRSYDGVHVWILCSVPCCTGNWVKSVWTSADGGRTWSERSGTDPKRIGSIPFSGSAEALTVTTAGVGIFGASESGGIWRSSDSATTWRSTFIDVCIEGGNAVTETWFVTPLVGWALAGGSVDPQCPTFLNTVNGGLTWTSLRSPF